MYHSCKCIVEQSACRCSSNESQSSSEDVCPGEPYEGQCSCCPCDKPMVRGKFGLAYVIETPKKKFCKPLGWQVEFEDTPSKIVNNCEKMMKWVNCPPLGDCNNIETNFCAYPEDCGQLLKERRNRPKCCCISKSTKKEKDVRTCCPREPKKKCKNQPCCSQNPEQVCIICDNCKVNAPGCCNPPKVLCCSKTSRKPPCKCQDRNEARCKCCTKEDPVEKCCKCCRPKLNSTFFRESLDKKYCEQEHAQCCCAKKFCICEDLLDYIPNKDTERNRSSEEKTKDRVTPYKDKERSTITKTEVREKPQTNIYKIDLKPVSKENKETKTDDRELRVTKPPVRLTDKKEPIEAQAKSAQSTNLIDELQERLKERKEKDVVAPKNVKHEENNRKNTTEVAPVKNVEDKRVIPKPPPKNLISESQPKDIKNEETVKKNTNEIAPDTHIEEEKVIPKTPLKEEIREEQPKIVKNEETVRNETSEVTNEEEENIPRAPSKDETPKAIEKDQVKVSENLSLGSKGESIPSVKSRDIASQPSILQKIKEAHKRQLNEIHPSKVPSINENVPNVEPEKSINNLSNPINEHKTEEEIKKIDYEGTSKTILEKIKEAHQKQVHEIHPDTK